MGHLSKVMRRGYVHSKCVHHFELFTRPHEHRIPGGHNVGEFRETESEHEVSKLHIQLRKSGADRL